MVTAVKIDPDAYYDDGGVQKILHISRTQLTRFCTGGLRSTTRGARRYFRGQWLIDWLEGSEAT